MAREFMSDEMVDQEILRLQASPHVKLARREEAIRNRKRQYMYQLRCYEKKGILYFSKKTVFTRYTATTLRTFRYKIPPAEAFRAGVTEALRS